MKLKDLINATSFYTRVKIYRLYKEHALFIADSSIYDLMRTNRLSKMTLEKEIDFITISKDEEGIALNVTICE